MSRIRTIKPEFWTNEQVVECSPTARLLFVGLWNFCDDFGNHPASGKTLKMEIFPGDDFSVEKILEMVGELVFHGLLIEYESDNKQYWHVTGWHHQKIEKASRKYPSFESGKIRRPVVERSANSIRPVVDQTPADVDVDVDVDVDIDVDIDVDVDVSSLERKGKNITPPPITLAKIRKDFREKVGIELGGGVNQELSEICQTYTPETISHAILATATRSPKPKNPFMYMVGVLNNIRDSGQTSAEFDINKDYPEGSFYHSWKIDKLNEMGAANGS